MTTTMQAEVDALATSLGKVGAEGAEVALVLGSGLGTFADGLDGARAIAYADIAGMPESTVTGHAGQLVLGEIEGVRVLVQQGRVHLYEGWSAREVTRAVRAFCRVGVRAVVLTNAAGGLREDWPGGTLMRITDHINMQCATPLVNEEAGAGNPYDVELGAAVDTAAEDAGVALERGTYGGLLGPSYETPAEVRMLRAAGADAVGMSTVAEALAAHAAGGRVAGISLVTNPGAGISATPLSHEEVVAAGVQAAGRFSALLVKAVPRIADLVRG
jgi:purine-nucleoside phosphorylase